MWEVAVSTVIEAVTEETVGLLRTDLDTILTSGTHISTTITAPGQLSIVFSNYLSEDDIFNVNNAINSRLVAPPTFTQSKSYTTGKLTIKNTAYTVLEKIIFQGMSPLRFSLNSYTTTSGTDYFIRFVNAKTKEIISEATFNNTATDDIMTTNVYTGAMPENSPIVIEIQGKISNSSARAYIDSIIVDYN